jgi:hypothetical protein
MPKINIVAIYNASNGDEITTDLNKAPTRSFQRELRKMFAFDLGRDIRTQKKVMEQLTMAVSFQVDHLNLMEQELKRRTTCICGDAEDRRILGGYSRHCPVHGEEKRKPKKKPPLPDLAEAGDIGPDEYS